jgi:hypothetical protein
MRRPSIRGAAAAALTAAVALASVAMFAGTASAARTPNYVTTGVTQDANGVVLVSTLADSFDAGDCFQNPGARVELVRPDGAGGSLIRWVALVGTFHTNHADIWHVTWTFKTAFGTPVGTIGPLNGPSMINFATYNVDQPKVVWFDPQLWPLVTQVEWKGEC